MDWFKLIVGVAAAIGLLYVGLAFLVPLAIAVLISSLLGALIDQIARLLHRHYDAQKCGCYQRAVRVCLSHKADSSILSQNV